MTQTTNHSIPVQGIFRRAFAAVWGFLQAMEYSNFDYSLDRIERLEKEVSGLKAELREVREASLRDAAQKDES